MKKSIWIFLLAVLLPSIVLGWLALRSADEQQIIENVRRGEDAVYTRIGQRGPQPVQQIGAAVHGCRTGTDG